MNKNIITCKEGYTHILSCKHERGAMSKKYRAKYDIEFKKGVEITEKLVLLNFEEVEEEKEIERIRPDQFEGIEDVFLGKKINELVQAVNELRRKK